MTLEDIQLIIMLMWIALFVYDIALVHKLDRLEEKIDELKKTGTVTNRDDTEME